MSRSGYVDEVEDTWQYIKWRGQVASSIRGRRGQSLLRELLSALDAMPDKKLWPHQFATVSGEYCALGVLGASRGIKMDDLGDYEYGCDQSRVAARFGVAEPLVCEIMEINDKYYTTPEQRWKYVRSWVIGHILRNEESRNGQQKNTHV